MSQLVEKFLLAHATSFQFPLAGKDKLIVRLLPAGEGYIAFKSIRTVDGPDRATLLFDGTYSRKPGVESVFPTVMEAVHTARTAEAKLKAEVKS